MSNDKLRKAAIFVIFGSLIIWGFAWNTAGRFLTTQVDGVIVASRDVPSTGAPRYASEYVIRTPDGSTFTLWAGSTDGSLPRSMPVGTHIQKEKWYFDYMRDGRRETFPYIFYSVMTVIGLGMIVTGLVIYFRQS